ncbi:MAG: hypothetical protein LAN37_00525 [Acidobacteriia bacterium]|nr:hypothetical protein [Terriglobia bacterium]
MHTTKTLMFAAVLIFLVAIAAAAQQDKPTEQTARPPAATYRVQYIVSEIADGKRINSRNYETLVQEPFGGNVKWTQIRLGNRVPIPGEKGPHYLDIGISIDTGLQREGDQLVLTTRFDLSSLAPEQPSTPGGMPVLRSVRFTAEQIVSPGQKVPVSSGDDVNTTHKFEVDAVVTRLK